MRDLAPTSLWHLPDSELDNDSLFWRWATLSGAVLFFVEFLWFLTVWNMLGFDRVVAAVAVTAGSALAPPVVLTVGRHRHRVHAMLVGGTAMSLLWLLVLLIVVGLVGHL
ncbi:hypothetical protein [Nocardia sp. GTS18]|uniref:hypothetical protein n=1 Tax=Nocardia sp. GTS18 TaxID=1778064 RepID=UPI0015EEAC86|nr:hypothetical protein [Nocardia sp. GTS18]